MNDEIETKDNVLITVRDAITGEIIRQERANMVTRPGAFHVLDRMMDRSNVLPVSGTGVRVAVGTGSIATDYWLGSLVSEVSGTGNPGRFLPDSISRYNQTMLITTLLDATSASGNLTEAGIFLTGYDSGGNLLSVSDSKDSGVLFAYTTFAQITKDETNTLTIDWRIDF